MALHFRRSIRRINYLQLIKVIGWLLIIEAIFMCVPIATALLTDRADLNPFIISALITLGAGLGATFLIKPSHSDLGKREGFLLTSLVWVVFSAFGMLPFILSDVMPLSVTDAFFDAMSSFTTTGVSLAQASASSDAAIMWRCVMQWLGGMGIILFTLAILPMLNSAGGMQMFNAEVTGITHDKIRPRISQTAMRLWGIYIILSIALFILLMLGPMSTFESICHTFVTISTGGYTSAEGGIGHWDSHYVEIILTVFMFLGGVNFSLIYKASMGRVKDMWTNEVLRAYVYIILGCYIIFAISIMAMGSYTGIASVTIDPLFQIVSTITSTGYTASDFSSWGPLALTICLILLFFGGCAGSTSGGAKIDRFIILVKNTHNELHKTLHPNEVMRVRLNGRTVPAHIVAKVIAFLCLYVIVFIAGGLILSACGVPMFDALFSSISCLSNIGLDAAFTGYGEGYAMMPDFVKWVLAVIMLIGRLELFSVLIIFSPGFWQK